MGKLRLASARTPGLSFPGYTLVCRVSPRTVAVVLVASCANLAAPPHTPPISRTFEGGGVDSRLWGPLGEVMAGLSPCRPLCPYSRLPRSKRRATEAQIRSEVLTLLSNLADLANAVHWLPPGILWAGHFPPWLVGLMGTISSLLSIYQAAQAGGQAKADSP